MGGTKGEYGKAPEHDGEEMLPGGVEHAAKDRTRSARLESELWMLSKAAASTVIESAHAADENICTCSCTKEAHNCVSTCTEAASEEYSADAAELISMMTPKERHKTSQRRGERDSKVVP